MESKLIYVIYKETHYYQEDNEESNGLKYAYYVKEYKTYKEAVTYTTTNKDNFLWICDLNIDSDYCYLKEIKDNREINNL